MHVANSSREQSRNTLIRSTEPYGEERADRGLGKVGQRKSATSCVCLQDSLLVSLVDCTVQSIISVFARYYSINDDAAKVPALSIARHPDGKLLSQRSLVFLCDECTLCSC